MYSRCVVGGKGRGLVGRGRWWLVLGCGVGVDSLRWWRLGAKLECAPAVQQERAPAA